VLDTHLMSDHSAGIHPSTSSMLRPPRATPSVSSDTVQHQWVRWQNRTEDLVHAWQQLVDRSSPGKAYLSPRFVGPALQHLDQGRDPFIVITREHFSAEPFSAEPAILMVADACRFSTRAPFPHLRAFKSIHSFMTGFVVTPTCEVHDIESFFRSITSQGYLGIEMLYRIVETPNWQDLLEGARRAGFDWVEYRRFSRAVIETSQDIDMEAYMTSKRRKAFKSAMKGLASLGPVEHTVVTDPAELIAAGERFLDLEDKGWKHDRHVSLRENPAEEAFFREMFKSFSQAGQARVCELRVGERVVASTIHLLSTDTSFAFKLGWDPELAKYKVGICQQVLTAQNARRDFSDMAIIDSCTEGESFFEKLWPGRRQIASGIFVRRGMPSMMVRSLLNIKQLKRYLLPTDCAGDKHDGDPCGH
jgi:hypothetical protein